MPLKDVVIGVGILSLVSFNIIQVQHETKVFTKGAYYYSDNQTIINYKSQYDNLYSEVPTGYSASSVAPQFNGIPEPISGDELLKIGSLERYSFFTATASVNEDVYEDIKDKSSYMFSFDKEQAVLAPTDLKVTAISPNTKSGVVPSFDSYFMGEGVTVVMEGTKTLFLGKNEMMNEYKIRIKLTNLSKTWQSLGHTVSYKENATGRQLYYTDFVSSNDYSVAPGAQVAVTGATGSIAETKGKTSYVLVTLEKRQSDLKTWKSMTFNEFYGFE